MSEDYVGFPFLRDFHGPFTYNCFGVRSSKRAAVSTVVAVELLYLRGFRNSTRSFIFIVDRHLLFSFWFWGELPGGRLMEVSIGMATPQQFQVTLNCFQLEAYFLNAAEIRHLS